MKEEILNVVESELFYGVDDGVMPVNETSNLVTKIPTFTGNIDPRVMPINNGRKWDEPFDIEIHGFELVPHKTDMVDFLDEYQFLQPAKRLRAKLKAEGWDRKYGGIRTKDEDLDPKFLTKEQARKLKLQQIHTKSLLRSLFGKDRIDE